MLLHTSNFLLLDEPTNHLDMKAKDVLLDALANFSGTVVFVSHDRYFIDRLATRVFEIGDGKVDVYPGNYEDYLCRKSGGGLMAVAHAQAPQQASNGAVAGDHAEDARPKRVNPLKLKQMENRQRQLEKNITQIENQIQHAQRELSLFKVADDGRR